MTIVTGAEACERISKFFVCSGDSPGSGKLTAIPVSADGGVDVGAVGRALGLEPSSVRLNGRFVSRGPDLVSSLTWGSLFGFFACRGLPVGASELDPVVVQGKPSIVPDHLCVKRKITLEDETLHKKNKFNPDKSSFISGREGDLDDIDSLSIKRKLKLEDDCSSRKNQKIIDCSSGMHLSLMVLYRIEIHPSAILQKLHPWNLIVQAQSMNSSSPLQSSLLGASMDTESGRGKTIWYPNFHANESDNIAHPLVLL